MARVRFKLKVTGDRAEEVQGAVDFVLNNYRRSTTSPVLRSNPQGFHAFVTVFEEASR
jgi:hypothetical protein